MWIAASLFAGVCQTLRNGAAKRLSVHVDAELNSWSRFAFNLPWTLLAVYLFSRAYPLPTLGPAFLLACTLGALTQLSANVALVSAFRHSTFAESIALHKLQVVFAALVGAAFFNEHPSVLGWVGIGICAIGTFAMNWVRSPEQAGPSGLRRMFHFDRGALLALTCGALLVVTSFAIKAAMQRLAADNPRLAAVPLLLPLHALLHVTWIEVVVLTAALLWRKPHVFRAVPRHAGTMAWIGATGFAGSLGWFTAFASGFVAYVAALGQIEAVLSVLIGLFIFREHKTRAQLPGTGLVVVGILAILL